MGEQGEPHWSLVDAYVLIVPTVAHYYLPNGYWSVRQKLNHVSSVQFIAYDIVVDVDLAVSLLTSSS